MAVLLETSKGDMVLDLFVDDCPMTAKNFLKLCAVKYFNNCLFHNVQRNFIAQTGDPTGTGKGGTSIYGMMYGDQARFFEDEKRPHLKHTLRGVVGMASPLPNANASQFYITTGESLDSLDGKHTIFGQVTEGLDVLESINEAYVDDAGRPFQNIRIRHTIVLDDPFDSPSELEALIPPESPEPQFEEGDRLEHDWVPTEDTRPAEEIEEETRKADARNRAVVLEMIGDLPEADAKPPTSVLFVCKLNPVTSEEDLEIIFSRFGRVVDCALIRDFKTGDSLCYAFIGFDNDPSCEEAYFKMNNVLIDDRRIKVDFSQSVAHLWKQFKKGGRKGNADMQSAADGHECDPNAAKGRGSGSGGGRLEMKGGARNQSYGLAAAPPMSRDRGGAYGKGREHTLMLDEENDAGPQRSIEQQPRRHEDRGHESDRDRDRGKDRGGEREKERDRGDKHRRHRSRSREGDRHHRGERDHHHSKKHRSRDRDGGSHRREESSRREDKDRHRRDRSR